MVDQCLCVQCIWCDYWVDYVVVVELVEQCEIEQFVVVVECDFVCDVEQCIDYCIVFVVGCV